MVLRDVYVRMAQNGAGGAGGGGGGAPGDLIMPRCRVFLDPRLFTRSRDHNRELLLQLLRVGEPGDTGNMGNGTGNR
jgi:hypothetical protein